MTRIPPVTTVARATKKTFLSFVLGAGQVYEQINLPALRKRDSKTMLGITRYLMLQNARCDRVCAGGAEPHSHTNDKALGSKQERPLVTAQQNRCKSQALFETRFTDREAARAGRCTVSSKYVLEGHR